MKSRDIYGIKSDKLRIMYGNEMSSENSDFLNIQPEATTGDKEKLQNETKD